MVDVVVADEHPAHVFGLDEAEQIVEELGPVLGGAGVDHHRLLPTNEHGVHGDGHGCAAFADVVVDQERLTRNLGWFVVGLGQVHLVTSRVRGFHFGEFGVHAVVST